LRSVQNSGAKIDKKNETAKFSTLFKTLIILFYTELTIKLTIPLISTLSVKKSA